MKLTCNQQTLSKALNTVSKAVTTRTTIPILKGILMELNNNNLKLSASDLDISIERTISVNAEENGSVVVLSKLFGDIIRKLPNEDILIEEKEENNIFIKTSSSEFNIVGLPSDEFPNIGEIEEESKTLSFNREVFKDMIKKTSFSASIDESKGVIVGVLFELMEDSFNMVALDGFRMAIAREEMRNEEEEKFIISAKILNEINKIVTETEEEEDVTIVLSKKKAVVILSDTKVILRLLEGEFIKYRDILPKDKKCSIKVNRSNLLGSIERASLLAKEGKNNLIKFSIGEESLVITSRSEEGNVREKVIIEKNGEDLDIGFNSKYVMDVLKALDEEEIFMEFNTNISPCLVKPVEGYKFEYLILPVRITS